MSKVHKLMNYREVIEFLYSQLPVYHIIGHAAYKADLDNTTVLCKILDNPQNNFKSVHIAGTNGKGSVSHIIASVLQEAGFKTGLYTSPHLKDFRERIKINGRKIPEKYVCSFVNTYKNDFERIKLSFFEMATGLAFKYFSDNKVDIAVIETGLGGRLDSTNIISPVISVITNIGYDHNIFLGNTLEKIAAEKAGIIKNNIPVIIGETQQEIKSIFLKTAGNKNVPVYFADKIYSLKNIKLKNTLTADVYKKDRMIIKSLVCPLAGIYQQKNIVTAVQALETLKEKGCKIKISHTKKGISDVIKNTGLQGRWQTISNKTLTICDVGHNADGIRNVVAQIKLLKYEKLHFVFGAVNDKDINSILKLLPEAAAYYFCKPGIARGLDENILKTAAGRVGLKGEAYPSVKKAYQSARKSAGDKDMIFIGGSTFVVAEVI